MNRQERILAPLGDLSGTGIEIGALHHPVVDRSMADVLYVDHADTTALHAKYEGHTNVEDIVDVDVVWHDEPLVDALKGRGPVDWVVASHVIEHVPDLVGWLDQLADVLKDGGVVSLAIPDKRFCFDIRRRETDPADVVGAWLAGSTRPSPGTVFDFYARIESVDAAAAWAGEYDFQGVDDDAERGLEWARKAAASDDYFDVHCWVFTPDSFLATLRTLFRLGLTSFAVVEFCPTAPGELEFFCALERLPRESIPAERRERQLASLAAAEATALVPAPADRTRGMLVSPREAKLIVLKRRTMAGVRALAGRVRPRRD